jgi:4-hydroxy-tetrahydrodipicolinate reductase
MIKVVVVGATGWIGEALVPAIAAAKDMTLAGAVARKASGQDAGEALGLAPLGVKVVATLGEALAAPSDVVVDYSHPSSVRAHVLEAVAAGRHVVVGTSGLGADDYAEIDKAARANKVGVIAAGNFSITATLLKRFAMEAARYVPDVEIIDYASAKKPDTPSGTARELAETLAAIRQPATSTPVDKLSGIPATRGAEVGKGPHGGVQVHSLRLPSFVLSVEALFGADNERLSIRHDAGESAAPYVGGTLLAIRRVGDKVGLRRGLDSVLGTEGGTA